MEKETAFRFFSLLFAAPQCFSFTVKSLYFKEGAELRLNPSISEEMRDITWKLDRNLVCEWVKDKLDLVYYRSFKGRTTLNISSGELEIRNATKYDAGNFTLELNNRVLQDQYRVQMIEEVPKPTVSIDPPSCGPESEKCTLSCDGNTENVGPVSYLWRLGDDEWDIDRKAITVYNGNIIQKAEKFSCRLKNPVSQKWSDPLQNPLFLPPPPPVYLVVGLVLGLICVSVLVALTIKGRKSIHERISRCFRRKTAKENGLEGPQVPLKEGEPLPNSA